MGEDDDEREPFISTLKFPLLPPPAADHYPSGTATPPLQTSASVPFKWEELPGKPRPCTDIILRPDPAKCLELPPCRMIFMEPAITKMPSPTTVIDGPYSTKFSSFRLFRESRASFDSSSSGGGGGGGGSPKKKRTRRFFSMKINGKKEVSDGGIFGFSTSGSVERCSSVKTEGKLRSNGSFSSLSQAASAHLWVTMRESLKKAMPWKSTRKSTKEETYLNK